MQRTEAVLLTALIFLGFNVAWLFLFAPLGASGTAKNSRAPPRGAHPAVTARAHSSVSWPSISGRCFLR